MRVVATVWVLGVSWMFRLLVGMIEHIIYVEILDGLNGGVEPSLGIEGCHRVKALERGLGLLAGISGSIDGTVEGILAECNGILEGFFNTGPCLFDRSFELIEVRLRLLLDGNLFHHLLVGKDEGSGDGRKRQDRCKQLHVDNYCDEE
jgi:hypothetical protein